MSIFFKAIQAHTSWKLRLTRYIHGESQEILDPELIESDRHCALGQWIHANETAHEGNTTFTELRNEHIQFHQLAGNIVRLIDAGYADEADKMLHEEYSLISHRVIQGLTTLRGEIGEQFSHPHQ